ncbi:MAG: nucleoprotein/polynucleotide-associated enzyme, partial [Rheinheimera sp.]|nr:nucleoprotein/polynucleotide-associated enzyme [Rheinheimera sp.]
MSNAFRDQLLKAGLADAKKVKKVKKEKHQQKTQAGKSAVLNNDASSLAQQAKAEQVARDKELNKQKQAELAQKAIAAQVKQMIETNAISSKGELGFNFVD